MVYCPISGFWPQLSSIIRVRQAVEGQELGPFAQVMRDSGDTVSGHIFGQSHKTGSREAIAAFVSGKGAFTASTDNGDCIVAPAVLLRERLVAVAPTLHLICNAKTFQLVARLFRTVSRIRIKDSLITQQKRIALLAVVYIASRYCLALDEAVLVNTRMNRVAICGF